MDVRRLVGHPAGHAVTIVCAGEMDSPRWQDLRQEIVDAGRMDGVQIVILDLAAVTFFDSSSIRAVIGARRELDEVDVTIHIDRSSPIVERVIDVSGLTGFFPRSGLLDDPTSC